MIAKEYACEFEAAIPPEFETRAVPGFDVDAEAAVTPGLDEQQSDWELTFSQGALSLVADVGRDRDDEEDDDSDFEFDDFDDEPDDDDDLEDDFDDDEDDDVDEDLDESDDV